MKDELKLSMRVVMHKNEGEQGVFICVGAWKIAHLADLTWKQSRQNICDEVGVCYSMEDESAG